ncbi:MAG: dethiobiotin synthase [Chitinophagales bacterium]
MHNGFCITGIGTGVGKTIFSAIMVEALEADYWKPVQSGELQHTDTHTVSELITNTKTTLHPEIYRLQQPVSPHAAAEAEGIHIHSDKIEIPKTKNTIIIEGAGGLMAPLNTGFLMIDLFLKMQLPVILIARNYLGSINHTLLSVAALEQRKIPIAGIVFNEAGNASTEKFILQYTGLPCLLHIPYEEIWNKAVVRKYAHQLKNNLL